MIDIDVNAALRELSAAARAKERADARFSAALDRCAALGVDWSAALDHLSVQPEQL